MGSDDFMRDKVRAGYDKVAEAYQAGRDQFESGKYLEKLDRLLKPGSLVLDVGCGSGKPVAEYFVSRGHKVVGLDISKEQVRLAKKNVPKGQFGVKDMSELQAGEYRVDAVVSFYAIFHTPREKHQELFRKFNSFLLKNGLVLVTMGSTDWEGSEEFFGAQMHWSHYGREKNSEIVRKAGFELLVDEIDETGGERHQVILGRKHE